MIFLFKQVIFRFHVSFRGCNIIFGLTPIIPAFRQQFPSSGFGDGFGQVEFGGPRIWGDGSTGGSFSSYLSFFFGGVVYQNQTKLDANSMVIFLLGDFFSL